MTPRLKTLFPAFAVGACLLAGGCGGKTYLKAPNEDRSAVVQPEANVESTDRREGYAVDQPVPADRY